MKTPAVATSLFTAAEYAKVIGYSPQHVRKLLKHTPASGQKIPRRACSKGECISAKPANAFEMGSLPSPIIQRLAKMAQKFGCSSPLELMLNPPLLGGVKSLADVADSEIERPQKLQRPLSTCLAMMTKPSIRERRPLAAPPYNTEFGKPTTV